MLLNGAGSVWQSRGIFIGYAGSANEVIATNRARIYSAGLNSVGYNDPGSNNTLRVTGQDTFWFGGHLAVVSFGARHNQLLISAGGQVFNDAGYVGNGAFNTVTITDPGSLWHQNFTLFVGDDGFGNQLHVLNGARVNSSHSGVISGTENRALISGLNSTWDIINTNGQLVVGGSGSSNQLHVVQNGRVNCWLGRLMGTSNLVLVSDAGSLWNIAQDLKVGDEFDLANGVAITAGGRVNVRNTIMAGDKGLVQLTGSQSVLNNSGSLSVGDAYGAENQLLISNGAQVNNTTAYVAAHVALCVASEPAEFCARDRTGLCVEQHQRCAARPDRIGQLAHHRGRRPGELRFQLPGLFRF